MAISASTAYTLRQPVGLFGLIGGFLHRRRPPDLDGLGRGQHRHVYSAAPADGRTVATGLAALAWTAASAFALRGVALLPMFFAHVHNAGQIVRPRSRSRTPLPSLPPPRSTCGGTSLTHRQAPHQPTPSTERLPVQARTAPAGHQLPLPARGPARRR